MSTSLTITRAATGHQLSPWKRWLSLKAYGLFTRTLFGATAHPHTMRRRFERFGSVSREAMQQKHRKLRFEDHPIGRLQMESVCAVEAPSRVIIHLHGGAYLFGSPASYRNRAMRLSYRCNAEVFVPDYRLAPDHRFPAQLEDALVAWQYVRARRPGVPIFISGDSAGGGLGLSLLVQLRDTHAQMPDGAILLSPWTDLSGAGDSMDSNDGKDLWLSRSHLERWGSYVLGDMDPRDPRVSPVYADLSGLPPLLVLVGGDEVLLDDARRVVEKAQVGGTSARLLVGAGMQHDFPLTLPWLDESRQAWKAMARFLETCSAPPALANVS